MCITLLFTTMHVLEAVAIYMSYPFKIVFQIIDPFSLYFLLERVVGIPRHLLLRLLIACQ
jgi:hypothetical protein